MYAYKAETIFDGWKWHRDAALVVDGDRVVSIVPQADLDQVEARPVEGAIVPGFIDLQVNGGGGVLLGPGMTAGDIATICAAHYQFGTTALLPTLITDTPQTTDEVITAAEEALANHVKGLLGLHLEGPHLSLARKGAHNPAYIRPMDEADIARLIAAAKVLPCLVVTVAAETVEPEQIRRLVDGGVIVSIGHSDASFDVASAAIAAGASMSTHLFNAMSQMGHRQPGVVGATLHHGTHAGLIADGIHVHPAMMAIALRAHKGPGRIFLVTDAMSQTGTNLTSFTLNGRTVIRADGALRLEDGTLAGADLNMIDAVRFMQAELGLDWSEALRMASLYPAEAVGLEDTRGHLKAGAVANFLVLTEARTVAATYIEGEKVFG